MFKFNFSNEETDVTQLKVSGNNEAEWYESKEVTIPPNIGYLIENLSSEHIVKVDYGDDIVFSCLSAKEVMNILKKQSDNNEFLDVVKADEQHSDLLPGRYEGGLKIWECTGDLAVYFFKNVLKKCTSGLMGKAVLDLGCGSGILGILCLQNGANVTFQDYNKEVLEYMTLPNIFLNCKEFKDKSVMYSGDWSSFTHLLLSKTNKNSSQANKFDYILTSETIYNSENYEKLIDVFKNFLKPAGVAFVAAKSHYFGVGGSLYDFMNKLLANGFKANVVWEKNEGILRKIVEVTFAA